MHYYKNGIEPITFIRSNNLNFAEGNVIKYITRYKQKGGTADLKKAEYYIKELIDNFHVVEDDIVLGLGSGSVAKDHIGLSLGSE